jgi:hypothetical protein
VEMTHPKKVCRQVFFKKFVLIFLTTKHNDDVALFLAQKNSKSKWSTKKVPRHHQGLFLFY